MPFCRYVAKARLFCLKVSSRLTGLECSYRKTFIPVTEISVAKIEIPVPHRNTLKFLRRKEWRGEISETEPARLYEEALTVHSQELNEKGNSVDLDRNNISGITGGKTHLDRIISRTYLNLYAFNCSCLDLQTYKFIPDEK